MADVLSVLEVRTGPESTPYVLAQVQWDTDVDDRPWVRVQASYDADGITESYILRGSTEEHPGDGLTPATRTYVDPQAPFGRNVTYTAQWASDPEVADWQDSPWDGTSDPETVTMPVMGNVQVLSKPGDIIGTLLVRQLDNHVPRTSEQPGSLIRVQNRKTPVPLWDVRTSEVGTMQVKVGSAAQLRMLQDLLADGGPLLSRTGHIQWVAQPTREIIHIGSVTQDRRSSTSVWVELPFAVVDDPEPNQLATVGTFDDMQAAIDAAVADATLNGNPGFEVDAAGWVAAGGSFARSTSQSFKGVASGLLTPDGITATVAVSTTTAASPAATPAVEYTFGAWVRSPTGYSQVSVQITWLDGADSPISSATGTVTDLEPDVWTFLVVTATAPALTAKAQIRVRMTGTPTVSDTLSVDEARFVDGSGVGPTFDGIANYLAGLGLVTFANVAAHDWFSEANGA